MDYLSELRKRVWEKAIGNTKINPNRPYCEKIVGALKTSGNVNIDWSTVQSFLNGNRKTSTITLDKFSVFVLEDEQATFLHFQRFCDQREEGTEASGSSAKPRLAAIGNWRDFRFLLVFSLPVVAGVFFYFFSGNTLPVQAHPNESENYFQSFLHWDLDSFLNNGWEVRDPDYEQLARHQDSLYFTLDTEIGDYLVYFGENGRVEKIKNLLFRRINCGDCCRITLKLSNFHPYQPYQQAGFFLFYADTINPRHYTRLTYTYKGDQNGDTTMVHPVYYDYYSDNYAKYGPQHLSPIVLPRKLDTANRTDSIFISAVIRNSVYRFTYRRNEILGVHPNRRGYELEVGEPKLLAIGAWQGHSVIYPKSNHVVDTIPVTFNFLKIEPCQ